MIFCVSFAAGQTDSVLQAKLKERFSQSEFRYANVSLSVIDIESNTLVAGYRPKKVLVPASSLKLLTTLTGLHVLGSDFTFETELYYSGTIREDGTLDGDIILKGGGDPTLGSKKFENNLSFNALLSSIAQAIISSGINCINGNLVMDESAYDSYPIAPSWQWNDLGNYYASGAWGININENQYYIHFNNKTKIGARPKIKNIFPHVPKLDLSNEITIDSAGTGDQAYIFGGPYNYYKRIVGTIPQGSGTFSIKGSLPDPPSFMAYHLKKRLEKENISVLSSEIVFKPYKKKAKQSIKKYSSPTLDLIVTKANEESNNLYTESILKMIGLKKRSQGSGQNGINILMKYLMKYGVSKDQVILRDGSGLSARNNISSYAIAKFLAGVTTDIPREELLQYLPKAGYTGTVRSMLSRSSAKGHVWLKSGSMEAVQSYSGYIQTASGKWVSVSVIVNGFSAESSLIRSRLQKIIEDIYKLH